jgi:hypothetical protein
VASKRDGPRDLLPPARPLGQDIRPLDEPSDQQEEAGKHAEYLLELRREERR